MGGDTGGVTGGITGGLGILKRFVHRGFSALEVGGRCFLEFHVFCLNNPKSAFFDLRQQMGCFRAQKLHKLCVNRKVAVLLHRQKEPKGLNI